MSLNETDILQMTSAGLYCPAGGFHIDPWKKVHLAVTTHAHSDHARRGMGGYICAASGEPLLRQRVGKQAEIQPLEFGQGLRLGGVGISLHPAGHILGSAQVRLEYGGRVAVVTGDYNATHSHAAAEPWEPLECDFLITESTFGLPIYQWPEPDGVMEDIHRWWSFNQKLGRTSILPCYPLGKTQRILSALDPGQGPIGVAGAARTFLPHYRAAGVPIPEVLDIDDEGLAALKGRGLLLISFSGEEPPALRSLRPLSYAAVSGWLQTRSARRGRDVDRAFVLSDHSDWNGILRCVRVSGAARVGVTHGETRVLARYLEETLGVESFPVPTHFERAGD